MKEIPGGIEHPPLNYAVRPDLGGTQFPFIKEIFPDSITYISVGNYLQGKVEIPKHRDFIHVSLENHSGNKFLEAFYNPKGELVSSNLWFRSYCERIDFPDIASPDEELWGVYSELFERKTEVMLEIDVCQNMLAIFYCDESSTVRNLKNIDCTDNEIVDGLYVVTFDLEEGVESQPVTFFTNIENNTLSVGFQTNKDFITNSYIRTFVSPEKVLSKPTPAAVQDFLRDVFIKDSK